MIPKRLFKTFLWNYFFRSLLFYCRKSVFSNALNPFFLLEENSIWFSIHPLNANFKILLCKLTISTNALPQQSVFRFPASFLLE